MKKYERKAMTVEAIQWFPGVEIPDFIVHGSKILYSVCGNYFRIMRPKGGDTPYWFSVRKYNDAYVQTHKNDGDADFARYEIGDIIYYRKAIGRDSAAISNGIMDDVSTLDPLYQDAALAYGWLNEPKWIAGEYGGRRFVIDEGQWLMKDVETGDIVLFDDESFKKNFEECTE